MTSQRPVALPLALALALTLTSASACRAPARSTPAPHAPQTPSSSAKLEERPFASVVALESVELAEPLAMRRAGRDEQVQQLVVIYLRLASVVRFFPKGSEPPVVMLEDAPALPLNLPYSPVWAVVAARPNVGLASTTLWAAPAERRPTELGRDSLVALRRALRRVRPGDVLSLAGLPSMAISGQATVLKDHATLLAHALARADSLSRRER